MKRLFIYIVSFAALFMSSCGKDFLTVRPIDDLTGNNYWQTPDDVRMFVQGLYANFRHATMNHAFFPGTGDLRCAPTVRNAGSNAAGSFMNHISYLRNNDLNGLFNQYNNPSRAYGDRNDFFGFHNIRNWSRFYTVIAKANIAIYEIERLENVISDSEKKRFVAEATFMRNLSYFFLVRLFGDVPYYTEAFHSKSIGRSPMLEVLEKVYTDMQTKYKDLPWTYEDPTVIGNRAMRGGALALMMHINMWLAGFSDADKDKYYERVNTLGKELMEENQGAYELLPLKDTKQIFKGRTKEGLFEIVQNYNYGELFHISATYADYVLRAPYKALVTASYIHYEPRFMKKMYPEDAVDERKTFWFQEDIYATSNRFVFLKYANIFVAEGEDGNPDDNAIVFRYADAILLRAEALAELGRDQEARTVVKVVRDRAKAIEIEDSGKDLKDAIWWERVRELLGEGHYFYDLVRTKRILNSEYTSNPISLAAFNEGAWTWPIDRVALVNNPYMKLNTYWNN
ncbi:RagB/SusD family nutrient uptake outer membrane protein [Sphingobacterium psychroaquaticum]|uniref:Starch-binding associating with outer membrane n=1 Tax=Sphingobacterium psychroaquaticum TaxID=561061 RepID=A0A1X7LCU0_9SPHI|nr:RagB/SusD family nutrient uptake outer membrane protein [Sphingobacterium psychroaquaticum]SMG51072.1 Starch-binding associating with outer membrane [Sphingobacterium psychroaquaticum]